MVMRNIFNQAMKQYLRFRYRRIDRFTRYPIDVQDRSLKEILKLGANTEYGRKYDFKDLKSKQAFAEAVPMTDYETLSPDIERMMHGEENILWPGRIKWFSKSSGTTSGRSKYIPVPSVNLRQCHIRGTWDAVTLYYKAYPDARLFADRSLLMGGSLSRYEHNPETHIGDISAIMMHHMPVVGKPFFTPDFETALLDNWEEKLERMAHKTMDADVAMFGGVPTWTIVLFRRMLEISGKSTIREIWPNVSVYMHGGVGFEPYKKTFEELIGQPGIHYQEIYNASEGFFGLRDDFNSDDMLLLLDNGVYYEFLPIDGSEDDIVPLSMVEVGKTYAILITTNGGLWRYKIGDTLTFTSTYPFKFKLVGRTTQFINAFGEELIVANTDKALSDTCEKHGVEVIEYTVAPLYLTNTLAGCHEWVIEFKNVPENLAQFTEDLDKNLQEINSDYAAKRTDSLALNRLKIHVLQEGTFHKWMKSRGKYGGQNKVPRLSNDRLIYEDLMSFSKENA